MKKIHTLIVGGTRGIGHALVRALNEDHILSVIGRRSPPSAERNLSDNYYWIVDLLDNRRLSKATEEIIHQNGKINNLIFFQRYKGTEDDWTGEIKTSLTATKYLIDKFADEFEDGSEKSIVIISSIASYFIVAEQPLSYHVAKAGLNQLVRYYAVALGPKGIRINCISCGTILKEESINCYLKNKQLHNLYKSIIPLGRMGTSEDVANVIMLLCSPMASFITGQEIVVDGGASLHEHESFARRITDMV